jgi:hypothetical protein
MDAYEVRHIFDRSLEAPAPPSSASVVAAVALGRRLVRRRRWAATAASGIMAFIVVAGGVAIAGAQARSPAGSADHLTSTSAAPPSTSAAPTLRPARFDPRYVHADFGWLPRGVQLDSIDASELRYAASYQYKPPPGGHTEGPVVSLELHQPGYTGSSSRADGTPTTPAPPVRGNRAVWVRPPGEGVATAILRWSVGAGASVTLTVTGLRDGLDAQQSAHRIADSLRIGTFAAIVTPLRLARVPAGMSLSSVWIQIQDDSSRAWEAKLTLAGGGTGVSVFVFSKPDCVCGNKFDTEPNTTINGTPAWVTDRSVTLYFGRVIAEVGLVPAHRLPGTAKERSNRGAVAPPDLTDLAAALTVYPNRADWRAPLGP